MDIIDSDSVQKPFMEEKAVTVSHIYKLTRGDLKQLFTGSNPQSKLKQWGTAKDVLKKLASDADTGIVGDEKDLRRRQAVFGKNLKPLPPSPGLLESIKQTCQDKTWLVVAATAGLSCICSAFAIGPWGLVEGVSIIIAAVILIAITSLADWLKDRKFVSLQGLIKDEVVAVIRGKFGATRSVSVWDLVVGDVIMLETGANVPADCLVLEAYDLEVSESIDGMSSQPLLKTPLGPDGDGDPFLKYGSNIVRGQTKALVCAVGEASSGYKVQEKLNTDQDTRLQKKLKNLSDQFTLFGIYGAAAIFLLLIIRLVLELSTKSEEDEVGVAGTLITKITGHINLIVVLIVVSIPEGLPLTIGVSLAFSVGKMYSENILVRQLDAPERMGAVDEICVAKTSTLTKNEMKVQQFYCENKYVKATRKDTLLNCELSDDAITRIKESILFNCNARIEMDTTTYVPVGNGTEVGLLKFLQDADIPVHLLIQRKLGKIRLISPFSSEKKRSAVALECPDRPERVALYIKGAPEVVLNYCNSMMAGERRICDLDQQDVTHMISKMAAEPLRVLGFAYLEMDIHEWMRAYESGGKSPEDALEQQLASGDRPFTWVGAFGMKDPLRHNVSKCVKFAREQGNLNIRMVSGDHIETAKAVAIKAGILRPNEAGRTFAVMTGEQFREMVGNVLQSRDEIIDQTGNTLENMNSFMEIQNTLKVLVRATPDDKLKLVTGLQAMNKCVAASGSSISDVESLQSAHVGLAMGSGCSAAKEASDIVLTTNDFEATLRAVMWGRNIYHNVSRFLQFQVTVNISALATVFLGGLIFSESPLTAVQLLWINLIMDTFAAIALSTEPPLAQVLQGVPFKDNAAILSGTVWRQIFGISAWNVLVMVFIILFGSLIGGLDYSFSVPTDIQDSDDANYLQAQDKRKHFTYIFNTFIFLQLFNEINCRKVGRQDFNVFEKFLHNNYFLMVLVGTFAFQIVMCTYFPTITGTEQMTKGEWGACIAVGSTNLLVAAVLKLTPESWVNKINTQSMIDEDKKVDNKVLQAWNQKDNAFVPEDKSDGGNFGALSNGGSAADEGDFTKA